MNLGLIVRGEQRGLGIQSYEAWRALRPAKTLLVDMGDLARGFVSNGDQYPAATVCPYRQGELDEGIVRRWLDGLDVVLTFEGYYGVHFPRLAKEAGVKTVCQANPEFLRPLTDYPVEPDAWWAPTPWRLSYLPEGTRVVPVPVADDRFPFAIPERTGSLRVLHVAGHAAMADRNGTALFIEAMRRMEPPMRVRIVTQDERLRVGRIRTGVEVDVVTGGVGDYWRLYEDADVLVQPRRYGGLHLPAQEAMASGLAVVMSDCEPQRSFWPVTCVRSATGAPRLRCPGGRLPLTNARPEAIADAVNLVSREPETLRAAQERSVAWAMEHRWSVLRPLYEAELLRVVMAEPAAP